MVPEGWERLPLEKVAEVRTGVAKGKTGLKDPVMVPYLRVANVQDGHINLDEVKKIEVDRHQLERYALKYGDVLMNEGGDFDKLGRGDVWLNQIRPCLHQNHVFAVRPKKEKIDSYYLAALAASGYGKAYFLSCAKRSTNLASINSTQLKEFPVLVPPLHEQRKIANILSSWDKAITTTEKLLANSRQLKKALMQKLLTGKKRFPGFSTPFNRFHFSDILKVDVKNLGSKTPKDYEFYYISLSEVDKGRISDSLERYNFKSAPSRARRVVSKGDLLLSTVRPNLQGIAKITSKYEGCIASTGFSVLTPNENVCGDYIYHYLFSAHVTGQINSLVVGTNYPAISSSDVAGLSIYLPSLDEQYKIAALLNNCDENTNKIENKLRWLKMEKKALMQKIITGRVRVDQQGVSA